METIVILVFFSGAVMVLCYVRERGNEQLSSALRRGVAVSKYIVAVFVATFASGVCAALLAMPLLVYARVGHNDAAANLFSVLLDRPYFPLQTVVAFVAGLILTKWLKEGRPVFVWVFPAVLFLTALLIIPSRRSALESSGHFIWSRFFNWGCDCSATLLQWQVIFPLYTSIAFAIGAYVRGKIASQEPVPTYDGSTIR